MSRRPTADRAVTDIVDLIRWNTYSRPRRVSRARAVVARLAADVAALVIAAAAAFGIRFGLGWFEITDGNAWTTWGHVVASAVWIVSVLIGLAVNRLYDEDTLFSGGGENSRIVRSVIEASAALFAFVFLTQSFYVSRSWFAVSVLLTILALAAERALFRRVIEARRARGLWRRPALLISSTVDGDEATFLGTSDEFEVVGTISGADLEARLDQLKDSPELFPEMTVLIKARDFGYDEFWKVVLMCGQMGWPVFVHSPVRSVSRDRLTLRELGGRSVMKVAPPMLSLRGVLAKRAFDVAVACAAAIVSSPILAIIAISVAVSSGLPIVYRQERIGRGGKRFTMLKFRSMRTQTSGDPGWTRPDDDRRTAIGMFLRRTSLDELPQLWNVLRGDMSLIGPRPEQPAFVAEFAEQFAWYRFRHRIRPGMTGLAQSHGFRGDTQMDPRVQLDNWYIENWSIGLDVKILVRTIAELARGRNAY